MWRSLLLVPLLALVALPVAAQSPSEASGLLAADAGPSRDTLTNRPVTFEVAVPSTSDTTPPPDILWDFGDNSRTTGAKVTHVYTRPGTYTLRLRLSAATEVSEDTTEVRVYERFIILLADHTAPADQLELRRQQAAKEGILLLILQSQSSGPEAVTEEELSQQLVNVGSDLGRAFLLVAWTDGSVGANTISKFAQHIHRSASAPGSDLSLSDKGIMLLSDTRFGVLTPTAQTAFDQLQPAYVLLTGPPALELILSAKTSEEAKTKIFTSPIEYRLLGTFSTRTVRDIGITNFMSFGLSFLINRGVPISSIILVLMLPIIATILAFARQVIGIKAFGLVTPTMTTLSFLVLGLQYGLIVFATVLICGTLTRLILRRLRLLYLPRMALVLTSVSLGILLFLGLGIALDAATVSAFSVFPALVLIILAEEFIAVQFSSGARAAFTITAWTLVLSIAGYYLVSSEFLRTLILSYPELILFTIPINLGLGRWTGLRLTEYFRFRQLLRYVRTP